MFSVGEIRPPVIRCHGPVISDMLFSEKSEMNSLVLRSGAKMPSIGFGTFVGGKNSADAYKGIWIKITSLQLKLASLNSDA